MEKNIKIIIIGLVILAVVASLIFVSFKIEGPGTLIGGLAVFYGWTRAGGAGGDGRKSLRRIG